MYLYACMHTHIYIYIYMHMSVHVCMYMGSQAWHSAEASPTLPSRMQRRNHQGPRDLTRKTQQMRRWGTVLFSGDVCNCECTAVKDIEPSGSSQAEPRRPIPVARQGPRAISEGTFQSTQTSRIEQGPRVCAFSAWPTPTSTSTENDL